MNTNEPTTKKQKINKDVFLRRFKKNTREFAEMLVYNDSSDGMWCATDTNWLIFFRDKDHEKAVEAQARYLNEVAEVDDRKKCPVPRRYA